MHRQDSLSMKFVTNWPSILDTILTTFMKYVEKGILARSPLSWIPAAEKEWKLYRHVALP